MKSKRLFYINKISNLLLESRGDKMKIEDIAAAIGVTKKTIYNYFDSKQDLCECIVDSYIRGLLNQIRVGMKGEAPLVTLLSINERVHKAYGHCRLLLLPLGGVHQSESFVKLVEEYQQDLIEITDFTIRKGINEYLFDADINTTLVSKFYISGIQVLSNPSSLKNQMAELRVQHKETLFYLLKGICTPKGLAELRQMLDIKVRLRDGERREVSVA